MIPEVSPAQQEEDWGRRMRWQIARYAFAFLCICLATWARMEMGDVLGERLPFGTYFSAVIVAAWLGGSGPAIFCLVVSVLAAAHFIVPPANSLLISDPASQLSLLVFGLVGLVSIALFHSIARKNQLAVENLERIELLNQRLTAADRAKDEFISVLAHELRNPMAPMQSAAELLQHAAVSPAQVATTGQLYARHLAHMRRLVDDLFDVSRYLRGQLKLHPETIDLRQPIGNAVEFIKSSLSERGQVLKVLMPPAPLMARVDPVRITQAVSNVLGNAVKFTPPGGSITLLVEHVDNRASIVVTDSGIGIDPSMHDMIFEPFNQVIPGRARLNGGLGLGLTLVKKLVELHSGEVSVSSPGLGRGSSFTLSLPVADVLDEQSQPAPSLLLADSPASVAGRLPERPSLVLIVDDNQDAATTLAALIRLYGFRSEICHDGVSAIQMFGQLKPDFILLDIGLPNLDGYEVAARIQRLDPEHRSTIIAVTGWGGDEHERLSREAGIAHHLVKPILLNHLLPLISRRQRDGSPRGAATR